LVPQAVTQATIQNRRIETLDESEFVATVGDIDESSCEALFPRIFDHLPHERSLSNASRGQQKKVVGFQVAPEERHFIDAVEEIVAFRYRSEERRVGKESRSWLAWV